MSTPKEGIAVRHTYSVSGLPVVGKGPAYRSTLRPLRAWRDRLLALPVGAEVHVLLDNGDIVSATLRGVRTHDQAGHIRRGDLQVWVHGIVGSYSASRIRPAGGWWRTRGCRRVTQ